MGVGCILGYLFSSVSRLHYEVWALQFPPFHSFKDTFPPSEA